MASALAYSDTVIRLMVSEFCLGAPQPAPPEYREGTDRGDSRWKASTKGS